MLISFPDPSAYSAVDRANSTTQLGITHDDEKPILSIPCVRCLNSCVQNAGNELRGNGIGFEPPHGPCGVHRFE